MVNYKSNQGNAQIVALNSQKNQRMQKKSLPEKFLDFTVKNVLIFIFLNFALKSGIRRRRMIIALTA